VIVGEGPVDIALIVIVLVIGSAIMVWLLRRGWGTDAASPPASPRPDPRFEVVHPIPPRPGLPSRPPEEPAARPRAGFESTRHVNTDAYCLYSGRTAAECTCALHKKVK